MFNIKILIFAVIFSIIFFMISLYMQPAVIKKVEDPEVKITSIIEPEKRPEEFEGTLRGHNTETIINP